MRDLVVLFIHFIATLVEVAASAKPFLRSSDYLFVTSSSAARFIQVKGIQYVLAAGPYSEIFIDDSKGQLLMSRRNALLLKGRLA